MCEPPLWALCVPVSRAVMGEAGTAGPDGPKAARVSANSEKEVRKCST